MCVCVWSSHCYGCNSPPVTTHTIRENTVAMTGMEDEDLLFFSHSNVALAHLPYMVALERHVQENVDHDEINCDVAHRLHRSLWLASVLALACPLQQFQIANADLVAITAVLRC